MEAGSQRLILQLQHKNAQGKIVEKFSHVQWKVDKREKYFLGLFENIQSYRSFVQYNHHLVVQLNNEPSVYGDGFYQPLTTSAKPIQFDNIRLSNVHDTEISKTEQKGKTSPQSNLLLQSKISDDETTQDSTHSSSPPREEYQVLAEYLVPKSRPMSLCHGAMKNSSESNGRGSANTLLTQQHFKRVIAFLLHFKKVWMLPLIFSLFSLASAENSSSCSAVRIHSSQPGAIPLVLVSTGCPTLTSQVGLCQFPLNPVILDQASHSCHALENRLCFICSPYVHPPGILNIHCPNVHPPGSPWCWLAHHSQSHPDVCPACTLVWSNYSEINLSDANNFVYWEKPGRPPDRARIGALMAGESVWPLSISFELSFVVPSVMVLAICLYIFLKDRPPLCYVVGGIHVDGTLPQLDPVVNVPVQESVPSNSDQVMVYSSPDQMSLLYQLHCATVKSDNPGNTSDGSDGKSVDSSGCDEKSSGNTFDVKSYCSTLNHNNFSGNHEHANEDHNIDDHNRDYSDDSKWVYFDCDNSEVDSSVVDKDDKSIYQAAFSPPSSVDHNDNLTSVSDDSQLLVLEATKARVASLESQQTQVEAIVAPTGSSLTADNLVVLTSQRQQTTYTVLLQLESVDTQSVEDPIEIHAHSQDSDTNSEASSSVTVPLKITANGHKGTASICKARKTGSSTFCTPSTLLIAPEVRLPPLSCSIPTTETNAVFLDDHGLAIQGGSVGPAIGNEDLELLPIINDPQPMGVESSNFVDPFVCCFDHEVTQTFFAQFELCMDDEFN